MIASRFIAAVTVVAVLMSLPSCIVIPTKMPTKTRGTAGTDLKKNTLNLDHIQPGTSTLAQVKTEFASVDTGFQHPRLFWGRWLSSSFGVIAGMMWGFGPEDQTGGYGRLWHGYDLFVTFDEQGIATEKKLIHDNDRELWKQLREATKQLGLPARDTDIQTGSAEYEESHASFKPEEVQFSATPKKPALTMKYGPQLHIALQDDFETENYKHPDTHCYAGNFTELPAGTRRKNKFCLTSSELIYLIHYLDRSGTQVLLKK